MQDFEIFGRQMNLGWGKNFSDHCPITKLKNDEMTERGKLQSPHVNLTRSATGEPGR